MNQYSIELVVLDSKQKLMQLTLNNLTDKPLSDWQLTLDFARFIFPESLSQGSVVQVGTYTEIKPVKQECVPAKGCYQITFSIKSAPLTNYECGIAEAYISVAADDFKAHQAVTIEQIKLQLPEQKPVDKITAPQAEICLIPKPLSITSTGQYCRLVKVASVFSQTEQAVAAIQWLQDEFKTLTGEVLQTQAVNASSAQIVFVQQTSLAEHAYHLKVDNEKATISANSSSGFIHAVASLLQLSKTDEQQVSIQCVDINDKPYYNYRGVMLDCSRHFHSIGTVKRLINQMAAFKFNIFHWHLTDDEGWRIEIKAFPELTDIGAWRGPGTALVPQFSHLSEKYGGFYSQAEIRDVINYAQLRGITIIPEIDIPGHCRAAIKSLPELLIDADDRSEYLSIQAYTDNVLSPALAGTYEFLDHVIDEVCALFPSEYIHIGADEVPMGVWTKSEKCQQLMREQGYSDEKELQGHLLRYVETRIKSHGKRMSGWEEVVHGDKVSSDTIIYSWTNEKAGLNYAKKGFDVVMQPSIYTYFDLVQDYAPDEFGVDWAGALPLETAYSYKPLAELAEDAPERQHILGVQCALWCEVVLDQARIDHMLFPRLLANAEVSWSTPHSRDWHDFQCRLQGQVSWLNRQDIKYRKF